MNMSWIKVSLDVNMRANRLWAFSLREERRREDEKKKKEAKRTGENISLLSKTTAARERERERESFATSSSSYFNSNGYQYQSLKQKFHFERKDKAICSWA